MSKNEHIHKYYRVVVSKIEKIRDHDGSHHIERYKGKVLFRCGIPGCSHFKPRLLAIGMKSICWNCGEELILTTENTRLKKPTHKYCRKVREVA